MRALLKILLLSLTLTSCSNKNSSLSNSIPTSSFVNYPDISSTISDSGSTKEKNTFYIQGKVETIEGNKVIPFNTQMTLTTYSKESYNSLGPIYDYHIKRLHILFDRYNKYKDENGKVINNLKVVNDSYASGKEIVIDEDLYNLLEMSITLSKLTKGYFNPTMGSLIDGWNSYFSPYGEINEEFN